MTVYLDVYFLVNLCMDVSLLACTGALLRRSPPLSRLFGGSLLGAGLSCLLLPLPAPAALAAAFPALAAMLWLTFRPLPRRDWPRFLFFALLAAFALGGLAQALLRSRPAALPFLLAAAGGLPLLFRLGQGLLARCLTAPESYCRVEIRLGAAIVAVTLLLDTGNALREPGTGRPVAVVAFPAVAALFPLPVRELFLLGQFTPSAALAAALSGHPLQQRLRFLPYRSVGRESGLLPAFSPDALYLLRPNGSKTPLSGWLIAVAGHPLSDTCDGLIDPQSLKEALV